MHPALRLSRVIRGSGTVGAHSYAEAAPRNPTIANPRNAPPPRVFPACSEGCVPSKCTSAAKWKLIFSPIERYERRRALSVRCVFEEMYVNRTEFLRFVENGSPRPPAIGGLRENSFALAEPVGRSAVNFF